MSNADRRAMHRMVNKAYEQMQRQNALFSKRETLYWDCVDCHMPRWLARIVTDKCPEKWLPERGLNRLPEDEQNVLLTDRYDMAKAQWAIGGREYRAFLEDMGPVLEAFGRVAKALGQSVINPEGE